MDGVQVYDPGTFMIFSVDLVYFAVHFGDKINNTPVRQLELKWRPLPGLLYPTDLKLTVFVQSASSKYKTIARKGLITHRRHMLNEGIIEAL